jgi:hypothetical protein
MLLAVTPAAKPDEVLRVVTPTLGAVLDVMALKLSPVR